jgi:hypothetical protein
MVQLDLGDIQGNILMSYNPTLAAYRFFTITDPAAGRAFLGALLDDITDATPRPDNTAPATTINVALTHAGLHALGSGGAARRLLRPDPRPGARGTR